MADNGGARRRAGRRWLWIVAGIAAAGAVAAVVGVFHLPDRMYDGEEARAALQGGLLTAAAALTAVAGGLIALDETRQANAEVRRANENTHVRELYATAISQLGADSLDVRLGGIYALERVARDSAADQRTVVEVLSAFARVHSTDPALRPDAPDPANSIRPAVDVHAAVTVLARLPVLPDVPRADLLGANLTGPAALQRLQARGGTLAGVHLGEAGLYRARLTGANLHGTNLIKANLGEADLTGADLTGAHLGEADLYGARLIRADLGRADLYGAGLGGADLTGANLDGANLGEARLTGANLTGAVLTEANLGEARLGGANLTGAYLTGANLHGANLDGARLGQANLTGAVGLVQGQVDAAWGNAGTLLPEGLLRPASWTSGDASGS